MGGILTPREIEQFAKDGFIGPFRLVDPAAGKEIGRRIRDEVLPQRSDVYAHTEGFPPKVAYTRDRHLDSPLLHAVGAASAIVSRIASLLGPDFLFWRSDVFEQRQTDPGTYPHQDLDLSGTRVIPCIEAASADETIGRRAGVPVPLCVSAWVAFDKITTSNGGLYFIPGSHKEVIPEVPGDGFAARNLVLSRTFERSEHHDIEVEAGEFMIFHNMLVHGSYKSVEGERLAWTSRYVKPSTKIYPNGPINAQGQDLSRFGSVLVSGVDRTRGNVLRAAPPMRGGQILDEASVVNTAWGSDSASRTAP
jgi:non-haem Fe2+, alpha-ketoglutarate-dependent halogenase